MSETKFTRGPWYIDHDQTPLEIIGPAENYRRFGVDGERALASVGDDIVYEDRPRLEEEDTANAHLIAAAPDLYDALEKLLARYTQLAGCGDCGNLVPEEEAEVIASRAALAKARGETL